MKITGNRWKYTKTTPETPFHYKSYQHPNTTHSPMYHFIFCKKCPMHKRTYFQNKRDLDYTKICVALILLVSQTCFIKSWKEFWSFCRRERIYFYKTFDYNSISPIIWLDAISNSVSIFKCTQTTLVRTKNFLIRCWEYFLTKRLSIISYTLFNPFLLRGETFEWSIYSNFNNVSAKEHLQGGF